MVLVWSFEVHAQWLILTSRSNLVIYKHHLSVWCRNLNVSVSVSGFNISCPSLMFENMINCLTVVISPTCSTCSATQGVYVLDVVRRVSKALVQELWWCHSCVRAPIATSSFCVTFSCKSPVSDDEASQWKVVFHQPPTALAYALFATNRLIHY